MSEIPRGWDACKWEEAEAVLCANGSIYTIETKSNHGSLDSFVVFFEPGESEIGTHHAEHCLGMMPVKKNELFGLNDEEVPEEKTIKVDYAYIRDRTSADVRRVASFMIDRAYEIGQGDLGAFEHMVDEEFRTWWEMLNLRYAYLQEKKGSTIKD